VVKHGNEAVPFTVSLIGAHNVINLVGAIAICCEMGIDLKKLPPYARKIKAVEHRLQLTKRGNTTVVDDAYNSNPSGAKAALDAISLFQGKKVIVTPGMIELGSVQYEENRKFGMNIAKVCDFAVLVGQKQAEPIKQGLLDAGFPEDCIYVADELTDGANKAFSLFPDEEKVVLFENDLPDNY
jgi:UDP-N-acetylmuramoyl-tripeptide--D-alanyl-D-alanine ligase